MELTADLYLHYASLRAEDPVREKRRNVWLLTRYDDVYSVLRDPRFGRNGFLKLIAPQSGESEALGSSMRFQDPPGHTRLRNLVGKVFTQGLVGSLRPRIQRIVDNLLDIARSGGNMDVIAGLGLILSVQVILERAYLGGHVPDPIWRRRWRAERLGFNPDQDSDASFIARAQQKSASGIKVNASALGTRESQQHFGENLAKYDIQPVWLSIENGTDEQLVFLPITADPDYYSPYEVSSRFHGALSFAANQARDRFFLEHQIASILPPHSTTAGFMYGVLDTGVKYAHIVIAGNSRVPLHCVLRLPPPVSCPSASQG
jgi:hypothetical protein